MGNLKQMEKLKEMALLWRNGHPGHIARTVRFIVENDYLTGENIDVNGGIFMR